MSKIAVVTDTNSGITREEAKKLGVYLLPMPFIVDGTEYFEGVTCTYEHFFEMLEAGAEVSTSQPSPESLTAMWEEALATHDSRCAHSDVFGTERLLRHCKGTRRGIQRPRMRCGQQAHFHHAARIRSGRADAGRKGVCPLPKSACSLKTPRIARAFTLL